MMTRTRVSLGGFRTKWIRVSQVTTEVLEAEAPKVLRAASQIRDVRGARDEGVPRSEEFERRASGLYGASGDGVRGSEKFEGSTADHHPS